MTLKGGEYSQRVDLVHELTRALTEAVQPMSLADAGLSVRVTTEFWPSQIYVLQITAKPDGSLDDKGQVIPAKMEFTVQAPNTVVAGGEDSWAIYAGTKETSFASFEKLKLSSGANTLCLGMTTGVAAFHGGHVGRFCSFCRCGGQGDAGPTDVDTKSLHQEISPLVSISGPSIASCISRSAPSKTTRPKTIPTAVMLTVRTVLDG